MNEWDEIRELKLNTREVKLYRSHVALRKWKVTVEYRNGEKSALIFEDEKQAYLRFYEAGRTAIDEEAAIWN